MRNAYYQWKQGVFALLSESNVDYKKSHLWKNYYREGWDPQEAVECFLIDSFGTTLLKNQQRLGYEFEKILSDNIDELYIT